MNKPVLVIMAAGMGSRYGGLKQLDGVGPSKETIMDYSIFDAVNAGFGKLVFVIRKDFEEEFISYLKGQENLLAFEENKKVLIQSLVIFVISTILLLIAAPIEAYFSVPFSELIVGV